MSGKRTTQYEETRMVISEEDQDLEEFPAVATGLKVPIKRQESSMGTVRTNEFIRAHGIKGADPNATSDAAEGREGLRAAAAAEARQKRENRRLFLAAGVLLFAVVAMIGINAAVTWRIVDDSKETETNNAGELREKGTGNPIQVVEQAQIVALGMLPFIAMVTRSNALRFAPELVPIVDERHPRGWRVTAHKIVEANIVWDPAGGKMGSLHIVELATANGATIVIDGATNGSVTRPDGSNFTFCSACVPVSLKSTINPDDLDEAHEQFDAASTIEHFRGTPCDPSVAAADLEAATGASRGNWDEYAENKKGGEPLHPGFQTGTHLYHTCHAGHDSMALIERVPAACSAASLQSLVPGIDLERSVEDYHKCHPADATLELKHGGRARIDEVAVGDMIKTPAGFEPVLGFMQAEPGVLIENYVALTVSTGTTVKLSPNHWLPINGVPADPATAKVGDTVQVSSTGAGDPIATITKVELGTRGVGAYHLFTPSGQYYVDGVAATTYAYHPIPFWAWTAFGTKYVELRYNLGLPVSPATGAPGELPMDFVAGLYHGKIPELVEVALFPVTIGSAIAIEVYNAVAAAFGRAPSGAACAAGAGAEGKVAPSFVSAFVSA
jgi:hypothetical protein